MSTLLADQEQFRTSRFKDIDVRITGIDKSRRCFSVVAERIARKRGPIRTNRVVFTVNLTTHPHGNATIVTGQQHRVNTAALRIHLIAECWKQARGEGL